MKSKELLDMARGITRAPLVLKNARIVNVFTEEIIYGDIAICDGIIVGWGSYKGVIEREMEGSYVCPGFIDSHLHFESTLVTPNKLVDQAIRWGTTTFIADPHESANVSGCAGIDYILDQTENVPANVFIMLPSCVPATELDDNGFRLTADDMKVYLDHPRVLGLGEVMDYLSVVHGDSKMCDKLELFKGRVIDGHAPFLDSKDLTAYALSGIATDHECVTYEYAMEERRNGMTILIREGSAAKNLDDIIQGIILNNTDTAGFCFCTDDKHIEEIKRDGHIRFNVKRSVELGLNPIKAVKMATIQPAVCYGLKQLGAIAPGYQADLVVFDNLSDFNVEDVYYKGKRLNEIKAVKHKDCPGILKRTVNLSPVVPSDFALPLDCRQNEMPVIKIIEGQIVTRKHLLKINKSGVFHLDSELNKIAVLERHHHTGKTGVGAVLGFNISNGAIASTVSHDAHNIIVVGDNDEDMALAVNELIKKQGGYTVVYGGKIYDTLSLPVMGLMSECGHDAVNEKLKKLVAKTHQMGVPEKMDPFITLSFMALSVIPEIRITPRGVVFI